MSPLTNRQLWNRWAAFVSRRPGAVLFVGVALAVAAVAANIALLRFQPDRNDLIARDLDWNQRFIDWWRSFPGGDDMFVVVDSQSHIDADTPEATAARDLIDELGPALRRSDRVAQVVWGAPLETFNPIAARLQGEEALRDVLRRARQASLLVQHDTPAALVATVAERTASDAASAHINETATLIQLLDVIAAYLQPDAPPDETNAFMQFIRRHTPGGWQYMTTPNGRLAVLRVTPNLEGDAVDAYVPAIEQVRRILADVQTRHPGVEAGVTGVEVVEADETVAATRDSAIASAVALVLISLVLMSAFHSVRIPLLAVTALLIGIAWSFGFLLLAVGHLQVLSVVFVVILMGLGIDYGIHLASTFEQLRHEHAEEKDAFEHALSDALHKVAPSVIVGALTTAAAFATTVFTDFRGVAELGLIALGGIMLCLIAMLSVFPALLRLFKARASQIKHMADRDFHLYHDEWVRPFWKHPRLTLGIAAGLVAVSLLGVVQMRFDYDLTELQPLGMHSVQWQQRVVNDGGQSIWYGVSIVHSLDEARTQYERFRQLPNVDHLGGVGLLFEGEQHLGLIRDARRDIFRDPQTPAADDVDIHAALDALHRALTTVRHREDLPAFAAPFIDSTLNNVAAMQRDLAQLTDAQVADRTAHMNAEYADARQHVVNLLNELLDTRAMTAADLPDIFINPYIDRTDPDAPRYALHVYPKLPEDASITSPLAPRFLPGFVRQLQDVDPDITGVILQIYRSGELIRRSYEQVALIAFLIVVLIVAFSFGSLYDALLCIAPTAIGFALTFGLMYALGMQVNPANIIALPLMFGIGVDHGVHIVHRYRMEPTQRPLGLTHGTGKGITITSLTTIIGFASMMLASHRGIFSLGFVLAAGLTLTMLACWTVLPAWLELRQQRRTAATGTS